MAGDWIKMRNDLFTHPKVVRIASALKADTLRTVGGLMSAWCLFDAHSIDGQLEGYSQLALDDHLRWPGFSAAMIAVKWLEETENGLLLPEFDTHNGQSAKRRAQDGDRKRAVRKMSASDADKVRTREEKRREELIPSLSPAKLPTCPTQSIVDLYHSVLPELPGCVLMGEVRSKLVLAFWKWVLTSTRTDGQPRAANAGEALEWIGAYFKRARENDFLMGRTAQTDKHSGWKCDLDYLLSEKGKKQVIEKTEVSQ
jgi:hypothetical protein